jgi:hypothetical protein
MQKAAHALIWGGLFWGVVQAAEPVAPGPGGGTVGKAEDDDLRIRGVFDSALPRTEKKSSLRLIVHPHLGDLTKRDHIRTAVGFRYGITKAWEATAEADAYFTHGLKEGSFFDASGFSTLHLGTKYHLGDPLKIGWEASVGVDWRRPLGQPPVDVTDGLRHLTPYISLSHRLEEHPAWRVFTGFGWDDVTRTTTPGRLEENALGDDSLRFSGGVLYERGPLTYTLEATYATTRLTSAVNREVYSLKPGVVWVIPSKYTFGSNSKWLLGVALVFSQGPDGNDVRLSTRLRVNFDFKRLLGRKKAPVSGP